METSFESEAKPTKTKKRSRPSKQKQKRSFSLRNAHVGTLLLCLLGFFAS